MWSGKSVAIAIPGNFAPCRLGNVSFIIQFPHWRREEFLNFGEFYEFSVHCGRFGEMLAILPDIFAEVY